MIDLDDKRRAEASCVVDAVMTRCIDDDSERISYVGIRQLIVALKDIVSIFTGDLDLFFRKIIVNKTFQCNRRKHAVTIRSDMSEDADLVVFLNYGKDLLKHLINLRF